MIICVLDETYYLPPGILVILNSEEFYMDDLVFNWLKTCITFQTGPSSTFKDFLLTYFINLDITNFSRKS